ncbi:YqjF family protein [Haladaptatus sp. CMSO5]|uniref:YqjF family protein n=1 Tax=Haladaptatus sp. CMSO5 TaxID=3120514 RepID=UPI002FCE4F95
MSRFYNLLSLPVSMGWRHVLFANWPVAPEVVAAHLPDSLSVDTFDGQAWLSAVPFTNVAVRPAGGPQRMGFRLPELNLRTYVTHDGEPGVYFFSLDAQGVFGVVGARLFHHLPYYYARISLTAEADRIKFSSRRVHPGARPVRFHATYGPTGEQFRADPDSLEAFLTERYRYYTEALSGELRYAAVSHEPWPLTEASVEWGENGLFRANGFADPASDPVYLYSPGVDTVASGSKRIE